MDSLILMEIPLSDSAKALVPCVAVAEVSAFIPPKLIDGLPEWIIGLIEWRQEQIPFCILEKYDQDVSFTATSNCKLVIMNSVMGYPHLGFYAVMIQSIPKVLKVQEDEMTVQADMPAKKAWLQAAIHEEKYVIPRLEIFESILNDHYKNIVEV